MNIPWGATRLSQGFYDFRGELQFGFEGFIVATGRPNSQRDRKVAEQLLERVVREQGVPPEDRREVSGTGRRSATRAKHAPAGGAVAGAYFVRVKVTTESPPLGWKRRVACPPAFS